MNTKTRRQPQRAHQAQGTGAGGQTGKVGGASVASEILASGFQAPANEAQVVPTIDPAARLAMDWLVQQLRLGTGPQSAVGSLTDAGWSIEEANRILQDTLLEHHPGFIYNADIGNFLPCVVPEPLLINGNSMASDGERNFTVSMVCRTPRIVVFENFLSDEECDALIEQARPRLEPSKVIQQNTGAGVDSDVRTSTGMFFKAAETELVDRIERRISRLLHWPVENGEPIQVLNYATGAEYRPHQDYFDPADPGSVQQQGVSGNRVGTLLMYLNTPEAGGGTVFPDAGGLEVQAVKGRAVMFSYGVPGVSSRALHGAMPVLAGEKWAATKWMRQRPFQRTVAPGPGSV